MPFQDYVKKLLPNLRVLLPDKPVPGEGPRPPVVAIFGKHPGWSDHITLPLTTPALRSLWQVMYNGGIRSVIERGTWAQLSDDELIPFGHWFCSGRRTSWLIGRMWASTDKVGRRDYPMVACMDFPDTALQPAIDFASPILSRLESASRKATTASEVLTAMDAAKSEIAARLKNLPAEDEIQTQPSELDVREQLESHPDLNKLEQPLLRVLQPWSELLARGLGQRLFSRERIVATSPVRVPWCAPSAELALGLWARFTQQIAGRSYPMFLDAPDTLRCVDIIIGQPGPEEFASFRRSARSLPPISESDYTEQPASVKKWSVRKLDQRKIRQ